MRCSVSCIISVVLLTAVACGDGAERAIERVTGAPTRRIDAVSPAAIDARFGDEVPVSVRVTSLDGVPQSNVGMAFWPSDFGRVNPTAAESDANGVASTVWSISDQAERQTLKAQLSDDRFVVFTVTARNAWTFVPPAGPWVTTRAADEPAMSPWASTPLRGAPQLSVMCELPPPASTGPIAGDGSLGIVALRFATPTGTTLDSIVTWTLDDRAPVTEPWNVRSSGTALEYPWGEFNTKALIGWIGAARKFTIQFTEATDQHDVRGRLRRCRVAIRGAIGDGSVRTAFAERSLGLLRQRPRDGTAAWGRGPAAESSVRS